MVCILIIVVWNVVVFCGLMLYLRVIIIGLCFWFIFLLISGVGQCSDGVRFLVLVIGSWQCSDVNRLSSSVVLVQSRVKVIDRWLVIRFYRVLLVVMLLKNIRMQIVSVWVWIQVGMEVCVVICRLESMVIYVVLLSSIIGISKQRLCSSVRVISISVQSMLESSIRWLLLRCLCRCGRNVVLSIVLMLMLFSSRLKFMVLLCSLLCMISGSSDMLVLVLRKNVIVCISIDCSGFELWLQCQLVCRVLNRCFVGSIEGMVLCFQVSSMVIIVKKERVLRVKVSQGLIRFISILVMVGLIVCVRLILILDSVIVVGSLFLFISFGVVVFQVGIISVVLMFMYRVRLSSSQMLVNWSRVRLVSRVVIKVIYNCMLSRQWCLLMILVRVLVGRVRKNIGSDLVICIRVMFSGLVESEVISQLVFILCIQVLMFEVMLVSYSQWKVVWCRGFQGEVVGVVMVRVSF